MRTTRMMILAAALGLSPWGSALAQVAPPVVLEVDVENYVQYFEDTGDVSKLATDGNAVPATLPKNFFGGLVMGDIVAVNGQPAKGTLIRDARNISLTTNPTPGQAVADYVRNAIAGGSFEILKADGTPVGTFVTYGLSGGSAPPGTPGQQTGSNFAIVGGTGAFLGARGEYGTTTSPQNVAARQASMTEDPANRRRNGGGRAKFVLHIIPAIQPQVLAIAHSIDFSEVTLSQPATPGETLSVVAAGLGPCLAPSSPSSLATVNSPVDVTVNGNPAKVLAAVCYAGQVGGYQVNFQVPAGTARGAAALQMNAAWIPAPPVTLMIQ